MEYAQKWNSYRYHQYNASSASSAIADANSDLVIVYHTSDWSNMLTSENLVAACQVEKDLEMLYSECTHQALAGGNTSSPTSSSLLTALFDDNCIRTATWNDTVAYLNLPTSRPHLEDSISIDQDAFSSGILISYFPRCFLPITDVDRMASLVEAVKQTSPVQITFARSDLVESVLAAADLALLGLLSCLTPVLLLGAFMTNKLAATMVLLCMLQAVVVSISFTHYVSGFSSLSLYSLGGVPAFALLCSLSAFTFSHAWEVAYRQQRKMAKKQSVEHEPAEAMLDLVLHQAYYSTCSTLNCLLGVTLVVALSIAVSPIVSTSQLGKQFAVCLVCYCILHHVLLIPAFVVYAKLFPNYTSRCRTASGGGKLESRFGEEAHELSVELELTSGRQGERQDQRQDQRQGQLQDQLQGQEQGQDHSVVDPEESRDVVATSLGRPSSLRQRPSSLRSRTRSSPRVVSLKPGDMLPLATDTLVHPHFRNYHDSDLGHDDDEEGEEMEEAMAL